MSPRFDWRRAYEREFGPLPDVMRQEARSGGPAREGAKRDQGQEPPPPRAEATPPAGGGGEAVMTNGHRPGAVRPATVPAAFELPPAVAHQEAGSAGTARPGGRERVTLPYVSILDGHVDYPMRPCTVGARGGRPTVDAGEERLADWPGWEEEDEEEEEADV